MTPFPTFLNFFCSFDLFWQTCDVKGYLKDKLFNHPPPRTLDELRERVVSVIERIPEEMLKRVADNVMLRATACLLR